MPAVRLNRFLASTALVALLSAGGALAEPKAGMSMDTAPAAAAPDQAAAKPDEFGRPIGGARRNNATGSGFTGR